MKPRTLERLDLIASLEEAKIEAEIQRHIMTLNNITSQRGLLTNYRDRLADTWKTGDVVPVGQAMRASRFSNVSHAARSQIDVAEAQTMQALTAAIGRLTEIRKRRESLGHGKRRADLQAMRLAEQKQERLQPWRPSLAGG
jgi:flagellar biosynthesis chaperone FliJ